MMLRIGIAMTVLSLTLFGCSDNCFSHATIYR
jgi:hypothetical protein